PVASAPLVGARSRSRTWDQIDLKACVKRARRPRQRLQRQIVQLPGFDLGDHRLAHACSLGERSLSEAATLAQGRDLLFDQNLSQFIFDFAPNTKLVDLPIEQ